MEELLGRHILVITPCLNTPPEKKLQYVVGKVEHVEGPMMKLSGCQYTHLEGKVWERSYDELVEESYMWPLGLDGTCWINFQSERMRIYPFPVED